METDPIQQAEADDSTVGADQRLDPEAESPDERLLDEELLVEEISIDGMCGVY